MNRTIQATYDGKVLRPDEPLTLDPNTKVRLVVLPVASKATSGPYSFFEFTKSANLKGPKDWASRLHDYLYNPENKL